MYLSTPSRSRSGSAVPARSAVRILRPPGTRARRGVGQDGLPSPGQGVAIAGQLITLANQIDNLITNSGCGATCVQATNVVNQAEPLLQQNLSAYLSAPVHYESAQAQALANFEAVWGAVNAACASPSLGMPGANCIAQREQGACAYKTSPGGWSNGTYTYPGANGSGSTCWNWFVGYHDPIANDPTVVPDPPGEELSSAISSLTGGTLTGCFSLLTPFGIPDPCIAGIPIGLGTAAGIAILLAVLL
jgi:hypothetical protein